MLQRVRLTRHPQSGESPALEIEVEVARRRAAVLMLIYVVNGDLSQVRVPETRTSARADELWKHTCFEAFVCSSRSAVYWEFNLSPSLEWAAYRFDRYREGMAVEQAIGDPGIQLLLNHSGFRLLTTLDLSGVTTLPASEDWRIGLSAIIEDNAGGKSWWALAHSPGRPDFHNADTFALQLPP